MNNDNSAQSNPIAPLHTHHLLQLELQAVGGAIKLGRKKNDGLDAMRQTIVVRQIVESLDDI